MAWVNIRQAARDSPPRCSVKTLIRRTGRRNVRSPMLGQGFPAFPSPTLETPNMSDQSNTPPTAPRKILRPRRLALLASVRGLGMAVLAAGPVANYLPAWTASAHAAETTAQGPAGFADLVGKVKPAVISVRGKSAQDDANAAVTQRDSDENSDQSDSPEQFFRQFRFRGPDGFG